MTTERSAVRVRRQRAAAQPRVWADDSHQKSLASL
jgi:hypothetical protein